MDLFRAIFADSDESSSSSSDENSDDYDPGLDRQKGNVIVIEVTQLHLKQWCRPHCERGRLPLTWGRVLFGRNICENERIGSCWGHSLAAPGSANVKVVFSLIDCKSDVANYWVLLNFHGTTCIHIIAKYQRKNP